MRIRPAASLSARVGDAMARRLVLALPVDAGVAAVRDGREWVVAVEPVEVCVEHGGAAFEALGALAAGGFWMGFLGYDLGMSVERVVRQAPHDRDIPDLAFARFGATARIADDGTVRLEGSGSARRSIESAWRDATRRRVPRRVQRLGAMESSLTRTDHARAVRAVRELVAAGDCYQVNVTRRLHTDVRADPAALFAQVVASHAPPHAALVGFGSAGPEVAVVSASPELFLARDGRSVTTRPIKGTDTDPERLMSSTKDAAEHVMIVDLARNDLGRVCRAGSVRVDALMTLEAHPGLFHLVSTVRGELRDGVGLADTVRALFPAASITGAPKPRVMQAIEDLEPVPRGVYCGAVGWIDGDTDRAALNVAIRTFTITPAGTDFGVGGGVVFDSTATGEWAETQLKAAKLLARAGAFEAALADRRAELV